MKALRRMAAVVLITFLTIAFAHANSLVNTTPISGSTVTVAPSSVSLTVQAPLSDLGNEITVTDPKGIRVDDGALTVNGTEVVIGLKKLSEPGFYTVQYSLITDNDVPLAGQYVFNFDAPTEIASPEPSTTKSVKTQSANNFGTTVFVLFLLLVAIFVLIILSLYARKLYRER